MAQNTRVSAELLRMTYPLWRRVLQGGLCRRRQNLSFSHHAEVAALTAPGAASSGHPSLARVRVMGEFRAMPPDLVAPVIDSAVFV